VIAHVWEYEVRPEAEVEFRRRYGPGGSWVRLFRRAAGHVETLLLHDEHDTARYVTVDRWESAAAYAAFRERFAAEYAALDRECAALTKHERSLGTFAAGDQLP
jgi:heme-degrading monooxygenase HmoA